MPDPRAIANAATAIIGANHVDPSEGVEPLTRTGFGVVSRLALVVLAASNLGALSGTRLDNCSSESSGSAKQCSK